MCKTTKERVDVSCENDTLKIYDEPLYLDSNTLDEKLRNFCKKRCQHSNFPKDQSGVILVHPDQTKQSYTNGAQFEIKCPLNMRIKILNDPNFSEGNQVLKTTCNEGTWENDEKIIDLSQITCIYVCQGRQLNEIKSFLVTPEQEFKNTYDFGHEIELNCPQTSEFLNEVSLKIFCREGIWITQGSIDRQGVETDLALGNKIMVKNCKKNAVEFLWMELK